MMDVRHGMGVEQVIHNERGLALLAVLMVVCLLTLLGMTSMQLAGQEVAGTAALREERAAHHAAEAAVDVVMGWFHDPGSRPQGGETAWLAKRAVNAQGDPSYLDAQGRSPFIGTSERPDVLFDAADPRQDRLLNDPQVGWFKSLKGMARILKLRVYGAARPGRLCTVEVTAAGGANSRVTHSASVELETFAFPALHAPLQAGAIGMPGALKPAVVSAHWGDMVVRGAASVAQAHDVPLKSSAASVTGQSYGEMTHREDRWFDWYLGGDLFVGSVAANAVAGVPMNVHARQEPIPGVKVDGWDYDVMKRMAKQWGRYYGIDREGLLYLGGVMEVGLGRPAAEVFASSGPGDHRGLVFIDTLDGLPPTAENLGTIVLEQEYAEGLFIVNAHVVWKGAQSGKPVPALSPPPEGQSSLGLRVPVQLSGIHLQGVLYVAGDLHYAGSVRAFGAVAVQGRLLDESNGAASLEVWYNHDLREGLVRGLPVVFVAPGSWRVKL